MSNDSLESARINYVIGEAARDMNEALKRQDYKTAKIFADGAYEMLYGLYEQETDAEEKNIVRIKLKGLFDVIDAINSQLDSGNTGGQNEPI